MKFLDWIAQTGFRPSVGDIGIALLLIMSLVEITPIKFNPWSKIATWFGKMASAETKTEIVALGTQVEALVKRVDKVSDDLVAVDKRVTDLMEEVQRNANKEEEREAVTARVRILRFCDELQDDSKRISKDRFDQTMSDITMYMHYCKTHPDFKNNQTEATVDYITKCYRERLESHDFAS